MPASVASAAMAMAIPVESAAVSAAIAAMKFMITSVEAATAVESTVTAEAFVLKPAVAPKTPVYKDAFVKARAAIETTTVVTVTSVIAVEPGPRSDENAANEVVRAVIAVRSAGVRVVAIIAVSADWRRAYVCWSHTNADKDSLCVGERC